MWKKRDLFNMKKYNIICVLTVITLLHAPSSHCYKSSVHKKVINVPQIACPCLYDFRPVCGSDGVTYTNECVFNCYNNGSAKSGVTQVSDSQCTGCTCQNINLPVCTLDGQTYPNECELSCENIRRIEARESIIYLAHRAACNGPPCGCSTIASPVCGTDNILYRNRCVLECASENAKARGLDAIGLKNVGACLEGCQCPNVKEPVCGSDGVLYDNPCQVACQNRQLTCSKSPPVAVVPNKICESCVCTQIYKPVCGSDDKYIVKTFPNICELNCEVKRTNNPFLRAIGFGACPTCYCTDEHLPVCGTDGKTYKNQCLLACENDSPINGYPLSILYHGSCQEENCDCDHCPIDYQPVCGSDKATYLNICRFNCYNDYRKKKGLPTIYVTAKGSCSI